MSNGLLTLPDGEAAGRWLRARVAEGGDLSADSRLIGDGDGFVACPGLTTDGRQFIVDACRNGAAAILFESGGDNDQAVTVPCAALANLRDQAGRVSAAFYGYPSRAMTVFAVTGTNGKTTCAHWLAAGAAQPTHAGGTSAQSAAAVGTLGVTVYDAGRQAGTVPGDADRFATEPSETAPVLTTPDAVSLQRVLARLARTDTRTVALEASSIGLHQHRIDGTDIRVAVFTNLSHDHLDYHGDMAGYEQAKRRLFAWPGLAAAVVNTDDPAGPGMLAACLPSVDRFSYGFQAATDKRSRHLRLARIEQLGDSMLIDFDGDLGVAQVNLPVLGRFNALNAAAVCLAWHAAGIPFAESVARLKNLEPVAGRMQLLSLPDCPLVVVDYAHTPDALSQVLQSLVSVAAARRGQLWLVFGCGGDRDALKRAPMGQQAARHADQVVLTSDNPRGEPAQQIIDDIASGVAMAGVTPWLVEADRRTAIQTVLAAAQPNDTVLIAGKGHERYQEVAGVRTPFDDMHIARQSLHTRKAAH